MAKVLVTGADGFIGSHLAEKLVQKGHEVRALCIYNSNNSWGWLDSSEYAKDMEIVTGDVRDPFLCNEITKGIEDIYHLAALIAIPYSYRAPQSYIETNISGTMNICQAALENGARRVMQTSTSEVYGTAQYVPIDEKHPLQPQSPYSATKISSDSMAMSYFNSFDLPVVVARPFNTFGPRQSARAIIPTIITQIADGAEKIKLGDITPTRDFNFVDDTCDGMIELVQSDKTIGKTINIGSGVEISIGDLFTKINSIMEANCEIEHDSERIRPANSEVHRLLCDNTLMKELTSFEGSVGLDNGLRTTINWFKNPENLKLYKSGIYNV